MFGSNQDNPIDAAMLAVKKRQVIKTAWEPSTTGEYARWISRYGSVTFDYAGYQMAWAGMNEAGLMLSTMALRKTRNPAPDSRPPLQSAFWMQYLLDSYSTVEEVIASDAQFGSRTQWTITWSVTERATVPPSSSWTARWSPTRVNRCP